MVKTNIYNAIGGRIRTLRDELDLRQDELAKEVGVSSNTISRWETATYKPSVGDLQKLAEFFKVRLSALLPPEEVPDTPVKALLSATGDLPQEDIEALIEYAELRRIRRRLLEEKKRR